MDAKALAQITAEVIKTELEAIDKRFADEILQLKENLNNIPVQDISTLERKVEEAIAAIPQVKDGEAGKDGHDGHSVTAEDVLPLILESVDKNISKVILDFHAKSDAALGELCDKLPTPEKGKDGKDGPTADEVAKSMEGLFSKWALEFERNAHRVLEKAIDNAPKPKDGLDALSLEDIDITLSDDGRTVKMTFKDSSRQIEKSIKLATILDKGVFKDGAQYEKGDAVTFGGSAYVAQKDLPGGKPGASNDWRLFAKRGRDGRHVAKTKELPKTYKIKGLQDGSVSQSTTSLGSYPPRY